jgi:hypothetical protein
MAQGGGYPGVQAGGEGGIQALPGGNKPVFHDVRGKFGALEDFFKGGSVIHGKFILS